MNSRRNSLGQKSLSGGGEDGFRKRVNSTKNEKKWWRKDSFDKTRQSPELVASRKNSEKFEFFEDDQVRNTGSIFEHRKDMQSLKDNLPDDRINGIHIKLEDDCPQGGDDVRLCVLKTLGSENRRCVQCSLCSQNLPVFDKYPLIDGTFYVSPIQHTSSSVSVKFESTFGFLEAVCVDCMYKSWRCAKCGDAQWFLGNALIIGTVYMFDLLSTNLCCAPVCRKCLSPVLVRDGQRQEMERGNFTLFGEYFPCSSCGSKDFHYIRRVEGIQLNA